MKKLAKIFAGLLALALLCSCMHDEPENVFTFHLAQTRLSGLERDLEQFELPYSKIKCTLQKNHFVSINELEKVELAEVKLETGGSILGYYFTFTQVGKNRLLAATAANIGAIIVLKDNDKVIASRKIDTTISDGMLFMIPEADIENNEKLAEQMEQWSESIKRMRVIRDSLW